MNQQQLAEEAELTNGDVGAARGLQTFDTSDTHTDVSGLNHRDVVGPVADGEQDGLEVPLDQLDHQRLL